MHYSSVENKINFEIKSEIIGFKTADLKDIDYIMQLENDEENKKFVMQWTKEQHISTLISSPYDTEFIIYDIKNNKPVGFTIVMNIHTYDENIHIKRLVIAEKNKGFGRASLELLKKWAFEKMNAHRLWLDVKDFNHKAKKLYESSGFIQEGKTRESSKEQDSSYTSYYIMSILESEYYPQHT